MYVENLIQDDIKLLSCLDFKLEPGPIALQHKHRRKGNKGKHIEMESSVLRKTNFLKRSLFYREAVSWNQVLTKIPETPICSFKKLIEVLCVGIGRSLCLYLYVYVHYVKQCVIIFKLIVSVVFIIDFCKYPRPFEKRIPERLPCSI